MKLTVVSHKLHWPSANSPSDYATDGGFAFQMKALAELFEQTNLVVPCLANGKQASEVPIVGHHLQVVPLSIPSGQGWRRKLAIIPWLIKNGPILWGQIRQADAVHTPIPSDIGTIGLVLALLWRRPLFVRYCGNWFNQTTMAEQVWKWLMEHFAGGRNVMLATGGAETSPSSRNPHIRWIFSTSLSQDELEKYARIRQLPSSPRLIIVGRQEKLKGTDIVIKGLSQLQVHFPDIHLDVVGDGQALPAFKQLAQEQRVAACITFHGKVDHEHVMTLLQRADLLTFPTTSSEGFPKVVHEALASGLPVITTRVSVLPQLIGQGGGLLLDEVTASALAQAVQICLTDRTRYQEMSRQAIKTAQAYSLESWQDTIKQQLQISWGLLRTDG